MHKLVAGLVLFLLCVSTGVASPGVVTGVRPYLEGLDALLASGDTTTIYLKKPMPIYLVYFTAFVADDGNVAYRRDIYDRDRILVEALRAQGS